jgi:imidazolonepropionase-like amidohydrolase
MFAIRADCAFDGERFVDGGATVIVEGSAIVGVESGSSGVAEGCPLTDYGPSTVLPGLIDAHVHLVADSGPMALDRVAGYSEDELDSVVTEALHRQLAGGVTTVRDLGDRRFNVVDRRDAQRLQDDGLPRILASGPPVTSPGGHCHYLGGEVASRGEIADAVRERADRGVDVVKVMASGGINTPGTDVTAPQFALEDLRLLVDLAHGAGLPVTAHSHAAAGIDQAIQVGVDGIEHASYLSGTSLPGMAGLLNVSATEQQLDALAASGIPVCPTLGGLSPEFYRKAPPRVQEMLAAAGVTPEQVVEMRMSTIRRMHEAGVRFVTGTDAGIAPAKAHGTCSHAVVELAAVVPVAEALATATSRAADVCGLSASAGRLRPGLDADVLIVQGDLSVNFAAALRDPHQVVVRGRLDAP